MDSGRIGGGNRRPLFRCSAVLLPEQQADGRLPLCLRLPPLCKSTAPSASRKASGLPPPAPRPPAADTRVHLRACCLLCRCPRCACARSLRDAYSREHPRSIASISASPVHGHPSRHRACPLAAHGKHPHIPHAGSAPPRQLETRLRGQEFDQLAGLHDAAARLCGGWLSDRERELCARAREAAAAAEAAACEEEAAAQAADEHRVRVRGRAEAAEADARVEAEAVENAGREMATAAATWDGQLRVKTAWLEQQARGCIRADRGCSRIEPMDR